MQHAISTMQNGRASDQISASLKWSCRMFARKASTAERWTFKRYWETLFIEVMEAGFVPDSVDGRQSGLINIEQCPGYGADYFASVDVSRFVRNPHTGKTSFDFEAFAKTVKMGVRMLDNAIDCCSAPQSRIEAMQSTRVIGIRLAGMVDALAMNRITPGTERARNYESVIVRKLSDVAMEASVMLAMEKGSFPGFDAESYLKRHSTLPDNIKRFVGENGIRNSFIHFAVEPAHEQTSNSLFTKIGNELRQSAKIFRFAPQLTG